MKALPDGFDVNGLYPALLNGWGIDPTAADFISVGFGSYHWIVSTAETRRYFVTIDDLDRKPWLGETRRSTFTGLARAFDTALALRTQRMLKFVIAPLPTVQGETVRRIGGRHAIALFPFVEGRAGQFGQSLLPTESTEVVRMLTELHKAAALSVAPRVNVPLPARGDLGAALLEVDRPWHGGPYAEPARAWLTAHAPNLRRRLQEFDFLVGTLGVRDLVITHGEPHAGNVVRGQDGPMLIDWDTVALAPPERDLWMLSLNDQEMAQYADATGHEVDETALSLYRMAWDLADVAAYVDLFRSTHQRTDDTAQAWRFLTQMS